jgi:hypothetical protein
VLFLARQIRIAGMIKLSKLTMLFLSTAIGCQAKISPSINAKPSRGTTTANGHTLSFLSDLSASSTLVDDTETVSLGSHTLVVEFAKKRVTWDSKKLVDLPSDTKSVDVEYMKGDLTLKANGIPLTLPKLSEQASRNSN